MDPDLDEMAKPRRWTSLDLRHIDSVEWAQFRVSESRKTVTVKIELSADEFKKALRVIDGAEVDCD